MRVVAQIAVHDFKQQQLWKRNLNFTGRYFSTGMVAIIQRIHEAPIAIHGFDFGKGSHGHYFQQKAQETCHDMAGEGFLFQQLQREGVLVPLACLESADLQELRRECAIMPLIPPANPYTKGCKKDENGERADLDPELRQRGDVTVYGRAGLPRPLLIGHEL